MMEEDMSDALNPDPPAADEGGGNPVHNQKDILRNRRHLKRGIAANSLMNYMLYDFWKLRKYGHQTGLIESHLFFRLSMATGLGERLERSINQEIVIPLAARLDIILERGWLYLNKWDYNLIALLRSLCREVDKTGFMKLNVSSRNAAELFRNVEPHFLVFYHRPQIVKSLLDILSYAHDNMEQVKFAYRETRILVERLLLFGVARPSLAQVILSANMVVSRRYISMTDLIENVEEPLISDQHYDVDERIHGEIYRYLDDLDKKLAAQYGGYQQMSGLRYFFPRLDSQTPDIGGLQTFLTRKIGPERKTAYAEMYSNLPSYVIDFTNAWIKAFETLLCRQPLIEQKGPVHLFSPALFSDYFSKLKYNVDQIERLRTQLPFFQIRRYLDLTNKGGRSSSYGEKANKAETQLLNFLDDNINLFRSLKDILYRLAVGFAAGGENHKDNRIEGEDNRGLPTGNQEIFRYAERRILADGWVNGLTVKEAVRNVIVLINLYLYELHEDNVVAELEDETKMRAVISNLIQLAERIANPDQIQRIRRKYPLEEK